MKKSIILTLIISFILIQSCFLDKQGNPDPTPPPIKNPTPDPSSPIEQKVEYLLSKMSLDEKIGQMTQANSDSISADGSQIKDYYLGSILSGGGSNPKALGGATGENWLNMYNTFQQAALSTRLAIPIIYGIDAVHGHAKVIGATVFPHNIGLGATRDTDLAKRIGEITAKEVAASGIDWTFGPCVTVPQDERWGRTYEGISENPDLVSALGKALIEGMQGKDLSSPDTILACAKHFVADGGTLGGYDRGNAQITEDELRLTHLPPYISANDVPVGSVMISFSSWNGENCHGNKYLITDILRDEIGFKGIVVSDWDAVSQIQEPTYADKVEKAVMAGIDMFMMPASYYNFMITLKQLVNDNRVPIDRIDDAVRRILTMKYKLGLFDNPIKSADKLSTIGCEEHRAVAREAVRKSCVLLKNDGDVLPISKEISHIHIAGSRIGLDSQCGGWTLGWQSPNYYIFGTTIKEAIENAVSAGTEVTYSEEITEENYSTSGAEGADIGIVIIGEEPYAEGHGDRLDLSINSIDEDGVTAIETLKNAGIPVVVIILSGRPLIITDQIDNWDAVIAAWLPGTEGDGVADVIFGDYNPTGKLSYTWPRSMDQIPINSSTAGTGPDDPLFPYGFGLSY